MQYKGTPGDKKTRTSMDRTWTRQDNHRVCEHRNVPCSTKEHRATKNQNINGPDVDKKVEQARCSKSTE